MDEESRQSALRLLKKTKDELVRLEKVKNDLSVMLAAEDPDDLWYYDDNGDKLVASVTVKTTPKINMPRLVELDPGMAAEIVKQVVDNAKVEELLDQGKWSEYLVREVITFVEARPGIRFYRRPLQVDVEVEVA